ncbi:MAG: hypothetical protein NT015_05350 [Alphaproteobacteria bacterium]|nr:hypothetical protein [Alphaproteobacteria bacterium]
MDGTKLHRTHDQDRGDGLCEVIETKPALINVAVAHACRGEEKLHRPDEQQHRPSDEALEAMLSYRGWDEVHAASVRPLRTFWIDWRKSLRFA